MVLDIFVQHDMKSYTEMCVFLYVFPFTHPPTAP